MNTERINGYGTIFRFITPILIVLVGFLGKMAVTDIQNKLEKLDTHFNNHLSEHKQIEIMLEQRLTRIETKLGGKYAQ